MKNGNKKTFDADWRSGYLMLLPFVLLFFVFTVLPVLSSAFLSFTRYDMVSTPHFIGFSNYVRMLLTDDVFRKSVGITLKFAAITGPAGFMLSFFLAWLINELSPKARSILSFYIIRRRLPETSILSGRSYSAETATDISIAGF